jgi:hypothetical protein
MMAGKGKIMRAFKMTEISAVDRPAQVHARMSIMKRDDGALPQTEKEIEMTEAEIAKKIADATAAEKTKAEAAEAELLAAKDKLGKSEATVVELTKKVADLAAANDIAKNDEVIKVGETEVRKSAVGDSTFAMFKAQHAEIAKANDARELVELTKRAETELSALPGEAIAKAAVLKSIAKMGEAERTTLETMLKGGQAALANLMKTAGRDGSGNSDKTADEKIDVMAKAYVTANPGTSFAKAVDHVMQTEEGRVAYNEGRQTRAA